MIDARPLVIQLFPFVFTVSAFIFGVLLIYLSSSQYKGSTLGQLVRKRFKTFFLIVYGGIFLLPLIGAVMGILTNLLVFYYLFDFGITLLQFAVTATSGMLFAGALALGYTKGSGYFLTVMVGLLVIGLLPLYFQTSEFILSIVLSLTDGLFLWIPLWGICNSSITRRLIGTTEPNESGKQKLFRECAKSYLREVLEALRKRVSTDSSSVADEVLTKMFSDTSYIGEMTRIVEAKKDTDIEPVEKMDADSFGLSTQSPQWHTFGSPQRFCRASGTWTLTDSEFRRNVMFNRFLHVIVTALTIFSVVYVLLVTSPPFSVWYSSFLVGAVVIGIPAALFDPLFRERRRTSSEVFSHISAFMSGYEEIMGDDIPITDSATESPSLVGISTDRPAGSEDVRPPEVGTSLKESLQYIPEKHEAFVQRVLQKKGEVDEESIYPLYSIGAGVVISFTPLMFILMAYIFPQSSFFSLYNPIYLTMLLVGLPLLIGGCAWWLSWSQARKFHDVRRRWLSIALSHIDAHEAGIKDVGHIVFPSAPRQYALFGMAGPNAARMFVQKIQESQGITDIELVKEGLESYLEMNRKVFPLILVVIPILLVVTLFSSELFSIMMFFAMFMVITSLVGVVDYYRKRAQLHRLQEGTDPDTLSAGLLTFEKILASLRAEYQYPLRLMLSRFHEGIYYTGVDYTTSTGHVLHEAVFIPAP